MREATKPPPPEFDDFLEFFRSAGNDRLPALLFIPMRDENKLQEILIARIDREGPITFRDFMDAALYDRNHGYYVTSRPKIGGAGDYYTASNIRPVFGATLARAFADLCSGLRSGDHAALTIIEMGAGDGQLAFDLLTSIRDRQRPPFNRLEYLINEISPAMRERQRATLAEFEDKVIWLDPKSPITPIVGIVFSNEVIDAMPVHRVRSNRGALEEQYVTVSANGLLDMDWGGASTPRLARYLTRMGVDLEDGQVIEVCLDAIDWLERVAAALADGYLLTIDYGDSANRLYTPDRRNGTLRCFYRHRLSDTPLARVGEQDITASVNFTALIEYGRDHGFEMVSFDTQREFLIRSGVLDMLTALEDPKARLLAKNLIVPGGLSDGFHVLVQQTS